MKRNPAKEALPAELKSADAKAKFVQGVLDAYALGTQERDKLLDRWDMQENYYKGIEVPAEKQAWPGAPDFNFPVVAPKLRQRRSQIFAAASQAEPMFRVKRVNDDKAETAPEALLEHNLIVTGFRDRFLAPALDLVMPTNLAVAYVTIAHLPNGNPASAHIGPFTGATANLIHPRNFAVYPEAVACLEQAKLHGHTYELRKAQIVELYTMGVFIDDLEEVTAADAPTRKSEDASATGRSETTTPLAEDPTLQLLHAFYRCDLDEDGVEEMYRATIHIKSKTLLSCSMWTDAMSLYATLFVKEEVGKVFTEGSPFKDAQGTQIAFDALLNQFMQNNMMSSRPPVLTEGWTPDESTVSYEPGQLLPQTQLGNAMPIPSAVDNSATVPLMNLMLSIADKATNVSDALTGGRSNARESTATEENIKAQAFQISSVDDMVRLSVGLTRIASIMLMLLVKHIGIVQQSYPDLKFQEVPIQEAKLTDVCQIALASKHVLDSPEQKARHVSNLFAQLVPMADRVDPQVFNLLLGAIVEYAPIPDGLKHKLNLLVSPQPVAEPLPPGEEGASGDIEQLLALAGISGPPEAPGQEAFGGLENIGPVEGGGYEGPGPLA
jgi:hypothetical protein